MKLAFVFPGQGAQAVGMMNSFAENIVVREAFAEASEAIGQDLWTLVEQGPDTELARTVNTQPVLLTAEIAIYRAWRAAGGPVPAMAAGHSLGEYAALCAAGVFSLSDGAKHVRFRAQAMQSAVPEGVGTMAVILGLRAEDVIAACAEAAQGDVVEAVNFNDPMQVVIAGHRAAVDRAIVVAKAKGAKRGLVLPVSAPFHSSLLAPAAAQLKTYLDSVAIAPTQFSVVHNIDVSLAATPTAIRHALSRQAAGPVRWIESIELMVASGVTHIAECGPGKALTGMVKRIAPEITCFALNDPASIESGKAML